MLRELKGWTRRQWLVAGIAGVLAFFVLGLPTAVVDNPVFGRSIAPTAWALPILIVTALLSGLLAGTYVTGDPVDSLDRPARVGSFGGLLALLAIGCPVCNKVVLLALGTTGAVNVFAPVQPYLAAAGVVALGIAVRIRFRTASACPAAPPPG